jgi:hypothetical protein
MRAYIAAVDALCAARPGCMVRLTVNVKGVSMIYCCLSVGRSVCTAVSLNELSRFKIRLAVKLRVTL